MKKTMKLSVITVSYNSAETMATCIESVLKQTYANVEYIIIDGNSRDNTRIIIRSYDKQL